MASETKTSTVRGLMRCRSCGSTSPAPLASPAYLRSSSQSGLRATSDLRVAVLSASGWMRGAALATAGLPTTATAASTARFDAHLEGRRREQLRHVGVQHLVGGRDLGEAEVDEPGAAVRRQHHVGQPQVTVRDAADAHLFHALPDAVAAPRR